MRFPFVNSYYHCALPILCLMVCWDLCAGAPPFFKGDNGKTETITVVNGTKEKRLTCILRTDSASYRWYKNGKIINNNNRIKYGIKKQTYLKIKNIRFSDQGDYVCEVSNAEGKVNKTIHLIVTGSDKTK